MILKAVSVGPFASNCYIIGAEATKEGLVIDPGDEAQVILKNIRELGLTIGLIVATHGHIDHVAAIREVKEVTKADFAIHADEVGSMDNQNQMAGSQLGLSYEPCPEPERVLKDGDSIDIGDLHFTVLHTPGHSPGGICLLGHGVVFSGDALFSFGIGRTDFPGASYHQLINSISTKLMVLPDETIVLPGHGPETTVGTERNGNPFLR